MNAQRVAADYVAGSDTRMALLQADRLWPQRQVSSSAVTLSPATCSMAGRVLWAAQICRVLLIQQGRPHPDEDIPILFTPRSAFPTPTHEPAPPAPRTTWAITPGMAGIS